MRTMIRIIQRKKLTDQLFHLCTADALVSLDGRFAGHGMEHLVPDSILPLPATAEQIRRQGFQGLVLAAFHSQFQPFVHVVMAGLEGIEAGDLILQLALFAQQGGQGFGIVPGIGAGKFRFDGGKTLFAGRDVKDAPKGCRNAGRGAGNGHEDH